MLVYVYQGALLCEECGEAKRKELDAAGMTPANPNDEGSFDSNNYPKGPTEEGESDSPEYCDHCECFLETELTEEGREYVQEAIDDFVKTGHGECAREWAKHYGGGWRID